MAYKVYYAGSDTDKLRMYRKQFERAVHDFIERSGQDYIFERLWWDIRFMDLFFVIDENTTDLAGFFTLSFIKNPQTGQPIIATIVHGWADAKSPHAVKYALQYIDENAAKMGILKVNIATKRNDEAFERYFNKFGYERADVIFEKDYSKQKQEPLSIIHETEPLKLVESK